MKTCSKCGEEKSREEFHARKEVKSGLMSHCKPCRASFSKIYNRTESKKISSSKWAHKSENREKIRARARRFAKQNPEKMKRQREKREKAIQQATPPWLTDQQKLEIKLFYQNCPEGYSVDHWAPILGKEVCGLNVIWNMRYLLIEENKRKNNKFTPYTEIFTAKEGPKHEGSNQESA